MDPAKIYLLQRRYKMDPAIIDIFFEGGKYVKIWLVGHMFLVF